MKNNSNIGNKTFEDEEVIKPKIKEKKIHGTQLLNKESSSNKNGNKEDLKTLKLYKTYELNEEGLRLYGKYKKQQLFSILKFSFFGTVIGYSLALAIEIGFKKMKFTTKDYLKTFCLISCMGLFTFYGVQISIVQFRQKQNILTQKYGKEIEDIEESI